MALKKQGMYARHWEQISKVVGFHVEPTPGFNFQRVLELGLMKHIEPCVEIGEMAAKEYTIEQMLRGMKSRWETINFDVNPYKNISFIIRGADDIQAVLDEHIVNSQAMQFSPY